MAGARVPSDKQGVQIHEIAPAATDPAIDDWLEEHSAAVNLGIPQRHQMFLFMAGSYGTGRGHRQLFQEALGLGYHVINLRYPNSWSVYDLCRPSTDIDCHEKVRRDILYGGSRSGLVTIRPANSIENRLVKLLAYLATEFPGEGWEQYQNSGAIAWESVVAAGHSQGGGHAALLGMDHTLARVVMLGAPADFSRRLGSPAPWLSKPHVTPAERYYGFTHVQDPGYQRQVQGWQKLGMATFGPVVQIDRQDPPYGGSHQLVTTANPGRPQKYHGAVAVDPCLPVAIAEQRRLKQAWRYLLGLAP